MVLAIALGTSMTTATATVIPVLSGDPIPGKSGQLFRVRMNVFPDDHSQVGGDMPDNLTRHDAEALVRDARGDHQVAMPAGTMMVMSAPGDPQGEEVRYTGAAFFPMSDMLMRYGRAWSRDVANHMRVVVISGELREQLFCSKDSLGKILQAVA